MYGIFRYICCVADHIDVVKETQYSAEYVREEDPKLFVSEKTSRGPLADSWLDEYWTEVSVSYLNRLFVLH